VALLLPLPGLWHYQGPTLEEGFMLTFPEQVLHGQVPNLDFLHLYGPGSLWVLAGAFKLFGTTIATERAVGFLQHAALAFGMWALIRPLGRWRAATSGVATVLIVITPVGLTAMAWNGALAAGVWAVVFSTYAWVATRQERPAAATRFAIAGGVCAGIALLYRPDLVLAVGAGLVLATAWGPRRIRMITLGAGAATTSLMLVHIAMAGIGPAVKGMVIEPVFRLRAGRSLPVPPSWDQVDGYLQKGGLLRTDGWPLPMLSISHQIVLWFWLAVIAAIGLAVGVWTLRGSAEHPRARQRLVLRSGGIFAALLVTQVLQRPDTAHLAWVTCVSFPMAAAMLSEALRERGLAAGEVSARTQRSSDAFLSALAIVLFVAIIPFYPLRGYVDVLRQGFGKETFGYVVHRGDRRFYVADPQSAADAQLVVDRLGEQLKTGESLIVAPADVSRTVYSDAYLYSLFPELRVGTRYIEMDPGIANAADSGLNAELHTADWLILSNQWVGWEEPNDSVLPGDPRLNATVAKDFCPSLQTRLFTLLRRCTSPGR
jgi:hypothetical protein